MDKTIDYYNKNANEFVQGTLEVNFSNIQNRFLDKLKDGSCILDFGCGSGRDTKYFLSKGYSVVAVDGSEELCRIASEYSGIVVRQMMFSELSDYEVYDGIWACASVLHIPKEELKRVLNKMKAALKSYGVMYISFKYGEFEGVRNDRYFTDFTLESFSDYIADIKELKIEEDWITCDARPDRGDEKWLNLILRKVNTH